MADRSSYPRPGTAISAKEAEVLDRLIEGHSDKQIARLLRKEVGTIKCQLHDIRRRLGSPYRARGALIRYWLGRKCMENAGIPV